MIFATAERGSRRYVVAMRALLILVCMASEVAAQPAATVTAKPLVAADFEGQGFFDLQFGLGASAADDLDFATSWSVAAGYRVMPRFYVFARLRHTSPFYKSLVYDAVVDHLLQELPSDEAGVDPTRTHETDLGVGIRMRFRRAWMETSVGGGLVYRIGDPMFPTQTHLLVDSAIGIQFTEPDRGREDHVEGMFFLATSWTTEGDFMKAIAGMSVSVEVL